MTRRAPDLDQAIDALRSLAHDDDGLSPDETRDRVLATLEVRGQRRRTVLAFGVVLGAMLCGTTAWGWISGWLPATIEKIWSDPPPPVETPRPAPRREVAPAPAAPPAPPAVVETVPPEPVPEPEPAPEPAPAPPPPSPRPRVVKHAPRPAPAVVPEPPPPAPAPPAAPPAPAPPAAPPPPPPARDPELALYRVAHVAHFYSSDPARALAAWNAYLDAYPRGRLAPEARYNRALTLVKLRRIPEAIQALEPFAAAAEGGYRRDEARRLVEALRAAAR